MNKICNCSRIEEYKIAFAGESRVVMGIVGELYELAIAQNRKF
jgi:hypothetical protein